MPGPTVNRAMSAKPLTSRLICGPHTSVAGKCVVTAQAIRIQVQTLATPFGAKSTDATTKFVGLSVLGIPVPVNLPPNTVIGIPGVGGLILNEQFCDDGSYTMTHTCVGTGGHAGMTVRALHLIAVVKGNAGIDVIVGEAHSDATFH